MTSKVTIENQDSVPPHVAEALAQAKEAEAQDRVAITEATSEPDDEDTEAAELRQKMMQRKYTFNFVWPQPQERAEDYDGPTFEGVFTSVIPDVRTRRQMGIARAKLAMGTAYEALDPFTNEINLILARLEWTVDASANPEGHWSHDFNSVVEYEMLQALYQEVAAHEAIFLRRA